MARRTYILMLVLALAGGMVGGAITGRFPDGKPEEARKGLGYRRVVVANEFHLVDSEGRERWLLGLSKAGEPSITFVNKRGWAPMAMGVNEDGLPFLNMILEPRRKGGPSLLLMDSELKNRAILGLGADGGARLMLLDGRGQARAILGNTEITDPTTGFVEKRPASSIVLFDERGKVIWTAPRVRPTRRVHAPGGRSHAGIPLQPLRHVGASTRVISGFPTEALRAGETDDRMVQ